jgi:hypothetical protein
VKDHRQILGIKRKKKKALVSQLDLLLSGEDRSMPKAELRTISTVAHLRQVWS